MKRLKHLAVLVPMAGLVLTACGGQEEDALPRIESESAQSTEVWVDSEEQLGSVEQSATVGVNPPTCGRGTYSFIDCRHPGFLERGCKARTTGRIVTSEAWRCNSCIDWGHWVQCNGFF